MNSKNLFASKTFWFNALMLAASVSGILPAKYGVPVATVANIGLRLVSAQPVTVLPAAQ